jgi:hypothetical protein
MPRKSVLLAAGVVLATAVGAVLVLNSRRPQVGRAQFERITEGMTLDEVEAAVGAPAGEYRWQALLSRAPVDGAARTELEEAGVSVHEIVQAEQAPAATVTHRMWWGDTYTICVAFDGNGKVIGHSLWATDRGADGTLTWLRSWLGRLWS